MKRASIYIIMGSIIFGLFFSCGKKTDPQKILLENAQTTICEYLHLQETPFDSIKINSIDTVTARNYAGIMLEMIEMMEYEYNFLYRESLIFQDEHNITDLENKLEEIEEAKAFFFLKLQQDHLDQKKLLLYISDVTVYHEDNSEPAIFFITPDFKVYEMDPFNNNLLM